MRRTRTSVLAAAVTVAVGAGLLVGAAPAGATSPTAITQREPQVAADVRADRALDRALQELVAMPGGPPGVIAIVQRGDRRQAHTFGVANVRTGRQMAVHDRMRLASTAKAFSGAAALALVSAGRLSLRDTIGKVPARLAGGMVRCDPPSSFSSTPAVCRTSRKSRRFRAALLASLTKAPAPRQLLGSTSRTSRSMFDPGTRYAYSNSDNIAVALDGPGGDRRVRTRGSSSQQVYQPLGLRCDEPAEGAPTSDARSSMATTTTPRQTHRRT